MAKKSNIPTHTLPALWFVKFPYRNDMNFFSFDLNELKKEVPGGMYSYSPEVYEVQFWLRKPIFKKYTQAQLKKLNIK